MFKRFQCMCGAAGGDGDGDSSDDGMQVMRDGRNASLRGIHLHLIADVLQQVGLTIAGSILWYAPLTAKHKNPGLLCFFGFVQISCSNAHASVLWHRFAVHHCSLHWLHPLDVVLTSFPIECENVWQHLRALLWVQPAVCPVGADCCV